MEKRSRGRPRTTTPDQKRQAARARQQARRQRLAKDGGRSITLAIPGDLLEALDVEAERWGLPRSDVIVEAARAQILGSEPDAAVQAPLIRESELDPEVDAVDSSPEIFGSEMPTKANAADPDPRILGSQIGSAVSPSEIPGSWPSPPRYRGRALLLAAATGAVLGSWLTLALR